jgi:hypothetical protein
MASSAAAISYIVRLRKSSVEVIALPFAFVEPVPAVSI